jgi:hypothetical protein
LSKSNDVIWLFDWPACFQAFSDRPDKSPHQTEPIRRRTQRAFLKSRDSTNMFRRSDFRNARSVRMASKWIDGKRMMESATVKKFEHTSCAEIKTIHSRGNQK